MFGPLLDRAEAAHQLVLLEAGTLLGGRTVDEFCIQQADRILALSAGGPVPEHLRERTTSGL